MTATNFKIRKVAPAATNKWYIKTTKGGYNKAMMINRTTGSVLPNCCGLVHGRWLECTGITDPAKDRLYLGNAENYYHYTNDGYKRSQTPKPGAIGCYKNIRTGNGHVIFVESVAADGTITFSESAYDGFTYQYRTMKKPYKYSDRYQLQGFILNPYVKEKTEPQPLKVGDKVVIIGTGRATSAGTGGIAYGIGWTREIIRIVKNAKYPYCVGLNRVATGWYQQKALKRK